MADEVLAPPINFPPIDTIPAAAIDRWTNLDIDKPIHLHLTRREMDSLYFCLQGICSAVLSAQTALMEEQQGMGHVATRPQFQNSRLAMFNGLNSLTRFMTLLMEKAQTSDGE